MGRHAQTLKGQTMPKKATKRRQAPCNKCKGFAVPARRVKAVARDARGRFKKPGR